MAATPSGPRPEPGRPSLAAEVRTLLWLQWRLFANGLRRGSRPGRGHIVGIVVVALISVPYLLGGSIGLTFYLREASPDRAAAVLALGGTFVLFVWLASPTASQQIFESLNLPRLLHLPVSLRALTFGGLLSGTFSLVAWMTLPFLLAVCVGAGRDARSAVQLGVASIAVFAALVAMRTVVGDVFDLVAEDRRTRRRLTLLLVLPAVAFYLTQVGVQDFGRTRGPVPFSSALEHAEALLWLPTGWFASGVRATLVGDGQTWSIACAALVALAGVGLVVHDRLQRRLYLGDLVRSGPSGVTPTGRLSDRVRIPLLSPTDSAALRALLAKDWRNLARNPVTPNMALGPAMFALIAFFMTRNTGAPAFVAALGAGGVAAFNVTSLAMNGLAILDHRGLAALLLSPVPRGLVLLSHGLVNVTLAAGIGVVMGAVVAFAAHDPLPLVIAPLVAVLNQLCFNGPAHLSSLYLPRYVDPERGRSSAGGASLLGVLVLMSAMPLVALPVYALLAGTWFLARGWVGIAVLGALVYAVTIYAVFLTIAARGFAAREEQLLAVVVDGR